MRTVTYSQRICLATDHHDCARLSLWRAQHRDSPEADSGAEGFVCQPTRPVRSRQACRWDSPAVTRTNAPQALTCPCTTNGSGREQHPVPELTGPP